MDQTRTAALLASHEAIKQKMTEVLDLVCAEEFPVGTRVTWLGGVGQKVRLHGEVREHLGEGYVEIACDQYLHRTLTVRAERLELIPTIAKIG